MTDYSYNIYNFTFYPAYLSMPPDGIKIVQIGGMSFKYPSSPMLSQPENIPEKMLCSFEKRSSECADTPIFCECLQLLEVPLRKNLEIILVDEGFNGNTSYTLHLHGYNAAVVGRGSFGRAVSKKEIVALDQKGKLERNIVDPVKKDSFLVPNKGYLILRFDTSNRGYWLWEARSTAISPGTHGPGMQFLMRVGLRENLPTVPIDFPLCGSNKGPDLIFEAT